MKAKKASTGSTLRWCALSILRPYLRNHFLDKGKWFAMQHLNPLPGREEDWERFGTRCALTRYGFRMYVDMVYAAHRTIYFTGEYEPIASRLIADIIGPGWRFIDVGANIGYYTLLGAALADEVISIEPNPTTRKLLMENIALNGFDDITVIPAALSNERGSLTLYQSGIDAGGANLLRRPTVLAREFKVDVQRGDDVVPKSESVKTLLKLDAEGFEHKVALGCMEILSQHCVVLSEITDAWLIQGGTSAAEYFRFMRDLGYTPYVVRHGRTVLRTRPSLVRIDGPLKEAQYNVLFRRN